MRTVLCTVECPVAYVHRVTMTVMTRMLTADLTDGSKTSALGLEPGQWESAPDRSASVRL